MNRSAVEEIKARLPVDEVIGGYIKLEKSGKTFKAKCPFHHEKTASFFVSPDRGGYYCFGCNAKGDIFTFVEQFEGLDFKGALKVLADRAGVPLVYDQKADSERDRLFQIMEDASKYFEAELAKSADAAEYVTKRGISDKTRQEFRIGYAPEGWRNLYAYLRGQNWSNDMIERAGLAKKSEDNTGNYYDRFRGRVMFPISDSSGRVIAFTGRILPKFDDGKGAKYLNSPDTPIFDKSSVLFGLDKAKNAIRLSGYSILVEGQMDLIMSYQSGVKNVVASSGTALTESEIGKEGVINNLGLLKRLSDKLVIAFDADKAGKKAAMRASKIAFEIGMEVKIAHIVGGKDAADLVLENPENWKNILRNTIPVVEFEIKNILEEFTKETERSRALKERVYPLIISLGNDIEKARYVKMITDTFHITQDFLVWDELKAMKKNLDQKVNSQNPLKQQAASPNLTTRRIDLVERRMFGLLDLMKKSGRPQATEYETQIHKISGDSFAERKARADAMMSDLSFEAEAFFGPESGDWDTHMRDLIANFEEDIVAEELVSAMNELRTRERANDQAAVAELAKKCQILSIRKAEIAKLRR